MAAFLSLTILLSICLILVLFIDLSLVNVLTINSMINMLTYSRSSLLNFRQLWKIQSRRYYSNSPNGSRKLISPDVWNALKSADILKPFRGKRGGRLKETFIAIGVITSRRNGRLIPERNRPYLTERNLLNIRSVNSDVNYTTRSSNLHTISMPRFCLMNARSLRPKLMNSPAGYVRFQWISLPSPSRG